MLLDVTDTATVTAAGRVWTVSAVPAGVVAELTARVASAVTPVPDGLIERDDDGSVRAASGREDEWAALAAKRFGEYLAVYADWLRWGLRSYATSGTPRTYGGRSFVLLDESRVEAILRWNGGAYAHEIGRAIHAANLVSEDEALGFLSPSGG